MFIGILFYFAQKRTKIKERKLFTYLFTYKSSSTFAEIIINNCFSLELKVNYMLFLNLNNSQ
jgi:hypothetical protein